MNSSNAEEAPQRRGSSQSVKLLVQEGLLCYICQEKPPVMINQFGGHICEQCQEHIMQCIMAHRLRVAEERWQSMQRQQQTVQRKLERLKQERKQQKQQGRANNHR
jgi:hypothetical protein